MHKDFFEGMGHVSLDVKRVGVRSVGIFACLFCHLGCVVCCDSVSV